MMLRRDAGPQSTCSPMSIASRRPRKAARASIRSFRFLPPARRRAITALYAFCREVDDVVDDAPMSASRASSLPGGAARSRAIFGGAPQHPVAQALGRWSRNSLTQEHIAGRHRRHGDGPRAAALPRLCDPRALLRPGRRRRRTDVGGNIRLFRSGDARLRCGPRPRIPADEHHPRRRRGRAPRSDLSAAGRAPPLRRQRGRHTRRTPHARLCRADAFPGRACARHLRAGARRAARRRPARATSRSDHGGHLSRAAQGDRARRFAVLDRRIALSPLRKAWIAWTTSRRP